MWWKTYQLGPNQRPSRERADLYPLNWDDMIEIPNISIIYQCNSGHFTTSENEWNRRNTTKLVFPRLCLLKSRGEDFKNGFHIFQFSWTLLVPKHSLLKYFTLIFTRHRSSKFEGSGPPLRSGFSTIYSPYPATKSVRNAQVAAVGHKSIFREASSASSEWQSDERRKNISKMPEIGKTRRGWQGLISGR